MLLKFCSIISLETTGSTSCRCGESVLLQELKVKISQLEEALIPFRSQLDQFGVELETQKKNIANLTTQVNAVNHLYIEFEPLATPDRKLLPREKQFRKVYILFPRKL